MLKKQILVFLAIISLGMVEVNAQQARPVVQQVKVHKGTPLKFTTLQALDSTTAKAGDPVPLRLAEPVVVDGITVLYAGETVSGTVTKVKRARSKGRNGEVDWKLSKITFADGTSAKIGFDVRHSADDFLFPFFTYVTIAPFIPFILLMPEWRNDDRSNQTPGKEFLLPAGSAVVMTIRKDHRVGF